MLVDNADQNCNHNFIFHLSLENEVVTTIEATHFKPHTNVYTGVTYILNLVEYFIILMTPVLAM